MSRVILLYSQSTGWHHRYTEIYENTEWGSEGLTSHSTHYKTFQGQLLQTEWLDQHLQEASCLLTPRRLSATLKPICSQQLPTTNVILRHTNILTFNSKSLTNETSTLYLLKNRDKRYVICPEERKTWHLISTPLDTRDCYEIQRYADVIFHPSTHNN